MKPLRRLRRPWWRAGVTLATIASCGDRAPPALWPDPPPPTLASPIGIDDPSAAASTARPESSTPTPADGDRDDPPPEPKGDEGDAGAAAPSSDVRKPGPDSATPAAQPKPPR